MSTLDKQLERLQEAYNEIEIPKELSFASRKGIERGKIYKQKNSSSKRTLKWTGSVAAAVLISLRWV